MVTGIRTKPRFCKSRRKFASQIRRGTRCVHTVSRDSSTVPKNGDGNQNQASILQIEAEFALKISCFLKYPKGIKFEPPLCKGRWHFRKKMTEGLALCAF